MKQLNLYTGIIKIMGLLVLLPFVAYMLAISKTVSMYRNLKAQEQLLYSTQNISDNSPEKIVALNDNEDVKSGAVIKILNTHMVDNSTMTDSYTPTLSYKSNGFAIYTGELILSGPFIDLTKLMSKLENGGRGYKIASVKYKTVNDVRSRNVKLLMTIIIQQVNKT